MAKKKTSVKKNPEQLRKEAIKDIDQRLDGDPKKPAKKGAAGKKKTPTKKTGSGKTAKAPKAKDPKPKRMSGLDAAAQVLAEAGQINVVSQIAYRIVLR